MPLRRVRRRRSPEIPPYPSPDPPPWALCWVLLHPFAFERGYPERPLATMPVDFDPATPAPNRLVARLRARHAVREAAAFSLPQDGPPGLALYPRPVADGGEEQWLDDLLTAVRRVPGWQDAVLPAHAAPAGLLTDRSLA